MVTQVVSVPLSGIARPSSPKSQLSSRLFETDEQRFLSSYRDAQAYHDRARQFARDGLRPSLVFNVASVAIECYLVALCSRFQVMPMNHNFGSLMDEAVLLVPFAPKLDAAIRALDEIFGICSLEDYFHGTPEAEDAQRSLWICESLQKMLAELPAYKEKSTPAL